MPLSTPISLEHPLRGPQETRLTQVHDGTISSCVRLGTSLRYAVEPNRLGNSEWKMVQAQGWPKKGLRVRVDHKGLISIHAGLLFLC